MLKIKKIKSFTLAELMVTMVVTTIVAGLALTVLTLFKGNLQLIENNYSQSTQKDLLEQQLTIDFNRYSQKIYNKQKEVLFLKNPLDSIFYKFSEKGLLRNLDTIYSGELQKRGYFKGKEIQEGTVDGLKVEFLKDKQRSFIFIYAEEDAQQVIGSYGN